VRLFYCYPSIRFTFAGLLTPMKQVLESLLQSTFSSLIEQGIVPKGTTPRIQIERTRDKSHGDFASNLAMMLAKPAKKNPRELAQLIVDNLPTNSDIKKVEIAGPGFINFYMNAASQYAVINQIIEKKQTFGLSQVGEGKKVQVEFVSANPTGPLHVGHGRGAAYGATVSNLLAAVGYDVHREYYVNDAGRQMNILATSVWLRYLEALGEPLTFPSNGYKGEYIKDIAATVQSSVGEQYRFDVATVFDGIPDDEPAGGDKETHIDGLIDTAQKLMPEGYDIFFNAALDSILADIKEDLEAFGVSYQEWFSERSLTSNGHIDKAVAMLKEKGKLYEKDGALWFKSTEYGDDKDRVVIRDNGQSTYFASDIAYHLNKFERGFDQVINIWGADHHGYIARVMASLNALGLDESKLDVLLVQFANLYRGTEKLQMSTRSGSFVTLRELREEVGADAARFFYVTRKSEQHMDFDLELAKSESKDNPVYYIQYAHARSCSVRKKLTEKDWSWDKDLGEKQLDLLNTEHELSLTTKLGAYPDVLLRAATHHEPHQLATYLRELAQEFHTWYNAHKIIIDDENLRNARLTLNEAVKQVIQNGLLLLGVSAPESM